MKCVVRRDTGKVGHNQKDLHPVATRGLHKGAIVAIVYCLTRVGNIFITLPALGILESQAHF